MNGTLVEANNRVRELEGDERREIMKILTEFTNIVRPMVPDIQIPLIVEEISFLICARVGDALSFTFPNLSRIESIFPINWGNTRMSPASAVKAG